jgi:hypothetical protein
MTSVDELYLAATRKLIAILLAREVSSTELRRAAYARIRRIELPVARGLREVWGQKSTGRIDGCLDITGRTIYISVQVELERYAGLAVGA